MAPGFTSRRAAWRNLIKAAAHGRADRQRIDASSGQMEPVTEGDHEAISYTATADAAKMALKLSTSTSIGGLFVLDTASGRLTPLARLNGALEAQLNLPDPEEFWCECFDGMPIQGWIQRPPDFDCTAAHTPPTVK
jgi:dipeptidyl aminopeptidase/acylaminoacyl peptidase